MGFTEIARLGFGEPGDGRDPSAVEKSAEAKEVAAIIELVQRQELLMVQWLADKVFVPGCKLRVVENSDGSNGGHVAKVTGVGAEEVTHVEWARGLVVVLEFVERVNQAGFVLGKIAPGAVVVDKDLKEGVVGVEIGMKLGSFGRKLVEETRDAWKSQLALGLDQVLEWFVGKWEGKPVFWYDYDSAGETAEVIRRRFGRKRFMGKEEFERKNKKLPVNEAVRGTYHY